MIEKTVKESYTLLPGDKMMIALELGVALFDAIYKAWKTMSLKQLLQGVSDLGWGWYQKFRCWFFGLNLDDHEELVADLLPVMAAHEDSYDKLRERVTEEPVEPLALEDLLELAPLDAAYDRELAKVPLKSQDGEQKYEEVIPDVDAFKLDGSAFDVSKLKALRKEKKKVKKMCLQKASELLAVHGRSKHDIIDATHLDRQAVQMTLYRECARLNITAAHSRMLVEFATPKVMTPDQAMIDSFSMTWNPVSEGRRLLCKNLIKYGGSSATTSFSPLN